MEFHNCNYWAKLVSRPLSEIVKPLPNTKPLLHIPSIVDNKYTPSIQFRSISKKDEEGDLEELVATSHRAKFGYLLDLICMNIVPPNDGYVIILDCNYKWVDLGELSPRPNSRISKLLVNLNKHTDDAVDKLKATKNLLAIDVFDSPSFDLDSTPTNVLQNTSIDGLIVILKSLLSDLDRHISLQFEDYSKPLKCIIIDGLDVFYWELRENHNFKLKYKELYALADQASINLNCKIIITKITTIEAPESKTGHNQI